MNAIDNHDDRTLVDDGPSLASCAGDAEPRFRGVDGRGSRRRKGAAPAFAVLDSRLEDGGGLDASAKAGAVGYFAEPTEADAVALPAAGPASPPPELPLSAERARRKRIPRVRERCSRNLSGAAAGPASSNLATHSAAPRATGDA